MAIPLLTAVPSVLTKVLAVVGIPLGFVFGGGVSGASRLVRWGVIGVIIYIANKKYKWF